MTPFTGFCFYRFTIVIELLWKLFIQILFHLSTVHVVLHSTLFVLKQIISKFKSCLSFTKKNASKWWNLLLFSALLLLKWRIEICNKNAKIMFWTFPGRILQTAFEFFENSTWNFDEIPVGKAIVFR